MFFLLSKTLDALLEPLAWVLILTGIAAASIARRSPRPRRPLALLAGVAAVVLVAGNPMVSNRLWWSLEREEPSTHRAEVTYDVVVLLGGLLPHGSRDPTLPPSYGDNVERLLVTFDLLRTERARRVIITGGVPEPGLGRLPEASALARQLEEWGIARERILVDDTALNTRQNAVEAAKLVRERGFETVLVVTSGFHLPRALGCFRAVGLEVDALPVDLRAREPRSHPWDLAPRSFALDRTSDVVREFAGRLVYSAAGYAR